MPLLGKSDKRDHGDNLLAEFESAISSLRERVTLRREVVQSRLAALESEHSVLSDLDDQLAAHTA